MLCGRAGEDGVGVAAVVISPSSIATGGLERRVGDGNGRGDAGTATPSLLPPRLIRTLSLLACLDGL